MKMARFGRFNLVGLLGAGVQLAAFAVLTASGLRTAVAAAVAVELAVLHNFFWHERFTWRDRPMGNRRERALRLGRFHATNGLVSLVVNTVLIYWLVERLHLPALPSALSSIAACALLNFFLADRWVYA